MDTRAQHPQRSYQGRQHTVTTTLQRVGVNPVTLRSATGRFGRSRWLTPETLGVVAGQGIVGCADRSVSSSARWWRSVLSLVEVMKPLHELLVGRRVVRW